MSSAAAQSELTLRVISGVALAVVALASAYVGALPFTVVWGLAGAVVAFEWLTVVRVPQSTVRAAVSAGIFLVALVAFFWSAAAALIVAAVCALMAALLADAQGRGLWSAAGTAYAAVFAVAPVLVREHPQWGMGGIIWMFAVVWATDIAGYFAGRGIGGPKLWPQVSPRKTWSGFIGGTLAGICAGYLAANIFWEAGQGPSLVVAAITSIAAQLGDLGESAFKRHWGVKDSGRLIPGHGGFMDRLDGFWAASLFVGLCILTRATLVAD